MISPSSFQVEDPQRPIEDDADVVIPHAPAKKIFGRLKLSLAYGLSVTPAVWMGVWLTARGLQEARSLVGIDPGLPVMNDLRGQLSREKATNSTEDLFHALYGERITYSDTTEMKVVNGEVVTLKKPISKAIRDFSIVPTEAELWEGLSVTRILLLKFSPPLHQWLVEQHSKGGIIFLSTNGESARTNRYARFDTTSGSLILYPSFFSLPDGEKVVVLAHESNHASEDSLDFFVDSYSLQSGLGTLIYRGASIAASFSGGVSKALAEPPPPLTPDQLEEVRKRWLEYQKEAENQERLRQLSRAPMRYGYNSTGDMESEVIPFRFFMPERPVSFRSRVGALFGTFSSVMDGWAGQNGLAYEWRYLTVPGENRAVTQERRAARMLGIDTWSASEPSVLERDEPRYPEIPAPLFLSALVGFGSARLSRRYHRRIKAMISPEQV